GSGASAESCSTASRCSALSADKKASPCLAGLLRLWVSGMTRWRYGRTGRRRPRGQAAGTHRRRCLGTKPKLYCIDVQMTEACMAILVGTASWTDPTLLACGRFYPPHVRTPEARLRHYASCFPIVEADSPYYGLPPPAMAHAWAVRTPPGFVFNVKAFRLFTGHPAGLAALPADLRRELPPMPAGRVFYPDLPAGIRRELWRRYLEGIEPLRQAGKLGAILFQFAPWVRNDAAGRALVEHCAQMAEGCLVAAEFRHASWLRGAPAAQT